MTDPTQPYQPQEAQEGAQAPQEQPQGQPVTDPAQAQVASNQVGPQVTSTNPEAPTQEPEAEVDLYADPTDPESQAPKPGTVYYCPACGKRVAYRQQCTGSPVAPHQATEVQDARELWDARSEQPNRDGVHTLDAEKLTPAPESPGQ